MSKASPGRATGDHPSGQRLTQAEMAERLERAFGEVKGLVVNTDSDGLLAGVVLAHWAEQAHGRPLPIVGFYDTQRLWLDEPSRGPDEVAWIDVDLRVPGATVVSQHIVTDERIGALREPPADVTLINPNHLVGAPTRYRWKYPFSTTAWAWALGAWVSNREFLGWGALIGETTASR